MTLWLDPDGAGIARAAALLRAGALVAFPTETVYGLGADATQGAAVAAIFAAKGRPRFNPLIIHYPSAETAFADVLPTPLALDLARAFWPGPLTLVLLRRPGSAVHELAAAGLPTLAVRVPAHPLARALLEAAGRPIAAPSANRSGHVSPTLASHVAADLAGQVAAILDGGPTPRGLESTVIDLTHTPPVLLRPGSLPRAAIERVSGELATPETASQAVRAPGMLARHYAPHLPLRLAAQDVASDEALLAFGPSWPSSARLVYPLSLSGDLAEAASRLFAGLRLLETLAPRFGLSRLAAQPVPEEGLGAAINDRLRRAAAGAGMGEEASVSKHAG
jgi:L-threonylcarbamoyladenylate synthase